MTQSSKFCCGDQYHLLLCFDDSWGNIIWQTCSLRG